MRITHTSDNRKRHDGKERQTDEVPSAVFGVVGCKGGEDDKDERDAVDGDCHLSGQSVALLHH